MTAKRRAASKRRSPQPSHPRDLISPPPGLALGYLTGKTSGAPRLWPLALYLPALLLAVYFSLWLSEAFLCAFPKLRLFWQELDRWWKIWNMVDTKPILAENAIGFTLGYLLRLRRERKRRIEAGTQGG